MRYKRITHEVDAYQYDGSEQSIEQIHGLIDDGEQIARFPDGRLLYQSKRGDVFIPRGHYLVRYANGDRRPVSPEIFTSNYTTLELNGFKTIRGDN